ncbi:uncharacterized protein [Primulina huaijiensis]|uniref:uncharacterized protein n=1 Tax=Primulina huaijiensis TaxID=1492673 RepID=UPI003CC77C43
MDSGALSASVVGRRQKQDKTRRSWNAREEEVLIQALKDVITKGWKSENGFKAGYLNLLENAMQESIPGSSLRGNPHINSKIHVWKKTYSTIVTVLSKSGVGWNDSDNTIDVTDETWETIVKTDPTLRSMRHKQWTHYHDWCEIFGNDRATGERATNFENALHEVLNIDNEIRTAAWLADTPAFDTVEAAEDSKSENNTPSSKGKEGVTSKFKKRKKTNDDEQTVVEAIKNLAAITQNTMSDLIKKLGSEDKLSDAQDQVLNAVEKMTHLSEDEQVLAAKLLFNNHNDLAFFQRLGERGKIFLVNKLLAGQ